MRLRSFFRIANAGPSSAQHLAAALIAHRPWLGSAARQAGHRQRTSIVPGWVAIVIGDRAGRGEAGSGVVAPIGEGVNQDSASYRRRWLIPLVVAFLAFAAAALPASGVAFASSSFMVAARVMPASVSTGQPYEVAGSVTPSAAGASVFLERYYSGSWHTITSTALSASSTFAFAQVAPSSQGRLVFRVYKPSGGSYGAGYSARTIEAVGHNTLAAGAKLVSGQSLVAPNGQYQLQMQSDGNLVLYEGATALWNAGTAGHTGAFATMQADGNLVVYSSTHSTLWQSGTGGHANAAFSLQLLSDSELVIYTPAGSSLWSTGKQNDTLIAPGVLYPGQYLSSSNGQYELIMQTDGNLVLYMGSSEAVWSTGTGGDPSAGAYAAMQADGNLVVYNAAQTPLWNSGTGGHGSTQFVLTAQSDSNLVIYTPNHSALWYSGTHNSDLVAPNYLYPGQYLSSPNGQYNLQMQTDGNLVLYSGTTALWNAGTAGNPGAYAAMQTDGNLVVYSSGQTALWQSGTGGHASTSFFLQLQSDGNLVIYTPSGTPLWYTASRSSSLVAPQNLTSGQYLSSPDGQYQLQMQSDGNLVLYKGTTALWKAGTAGHPGAFAAMQTDGNLVVYSSAQTALWQSGTGGHPSAPFSLQLQSDGNLVIYTPGGVPIWDTGTSQGNRTWGDTLSSNPGPYGQCTYEAEYDFHAFTGVYANTEGPGGGFGGNAAGWGINAAEHHWTVVTTPEVDSIVVMQPGVDGASSVGHVAWVLQVQGNQIYVDQMDVPIGNSNPTQEWYTVKSGAASDGQPAMQFILAP